MSALVTDHGRRLAREVITEACRRYSVGGFDDLPEMREEILNERFPVRDRGGVSMANARTVRQVRAAIAEFYQPDDYSPEPEARL